MTRLLDSLLGSRADRAIDTGGSSMLMTTFGTPDNEKILPSFYNAQDAYAGSGVVFGIILARLMLFSEAEFKFRDLATKRLYGSSALSLLEEPWPNGTTGELLARMEQDVSLAGNAFIRNAGTRLERLRPDWVTIVSKIDEDDLGREIRSVQGYFYSPTGMEDRDPEFFDVEEVAHWSPIPDPLANFRGMSWLTPVLREIDADVQMTDYKRAYLANAATPNLLIKYSTKIGPDKLARLSEQIQARHGGVGNAFRTMVLDEGADHAVLGNTFEQMSFAGVQAAGENRIAVAAGVPGIVAGLKEGLSAATYSNYEQAMRRFVDMTMRPNWRSACGALAKLVEVPDGSRLWFDTSDIAALRQGEKERADTFLTKSQTANALILSGYDPLTVALAIESGDLSLLKHTGRVPTTMYQDGVDPSATQPKAGQ